jgi:hypothetical protein
VYEKGKPLANLEDKLVSNSPEWLRMLVIIQDWFEPATDYIWAKIMNYTELDNPSACVTSYLHNEVYPSQNSTFYECTTCLKSGPPGSIDTGLNTNLFFNFPSGNLTYAAGILLSFGAFDRVYGDDRVYSDHRGMFSAKEYSSMDYTMHFVNQLGAMRYSDLGESWYTTPVSTEYELHAAHLTARLPILATMGAEERLPRTARDPGASEQPFIITSLEVRWDRGMGVLGAILAGQLLAVGVVYVYSRGVWVRDHDSFLAIARVLATAVVKGEGRSSDTGEELAKRIRGVACPDGAPYGTKTPGSPGKGSDTGEELAEGIPGVACADGMRYGTRKTGSPGREIYELDIWNDVDPVFPRHEGAKYV